MKTQYYFRKLNAKILSDLLQSIDSDNTIYGIFTNPLDPIFDLPWSSLKTGLENG